MSAARDKGHRGWLWIDNTVLAEHGRKIGPFGVAVYAVLAMHANNTTQVCWPSYGRIAAILGISRPTVVKAVEELEKLGLIAVRGRTRPDGGKSSNEYTLLAAAKGGPRALPSPASRDVNTLDMGMSTAFTPYVSDADMPSKAPLHELDSSNETQVNQTNTKGSAAQPPVTKAGDDGWEAERNFDEMCDTLAILCGMDRALTGARISKTASKLQSAAYLVSDLIEFNDWWRAGDWRGAKGEKPTLNDVLTLLPQAVSKDHRIRVNSGKLRRGQKSAKTPASHWNEEYDPVATLARV